jgi:hypothetical protein
MMILRIEFSPMHEAPKPRARLTRPYQHPVFFTNRAALAARDSTVAVSISHFVVIEITDCYVARRSQTSISFGGSQMARRSLVLVIFLSSALAACASHSASSGAGGPPDVVVLNGCRVDPARICNNIRGQSVDMSNGLQADPRMLEQNSARTANIFVPVKRLNGDEIFEVECGINTLNQSVSWAQVKTGPPVTDDDVKYLRARNFCSEP